MARPSADAYVAKGDYPASSLGDTPDVVWKTRPAPATPPWSFRAICSPSQRNRATPRRLRMLDKRTGKELWKTAYGQTYPDDGFGAGPRCARFSTAISFTSRPAGGVELPPRQGRLQGLGHGLPEKLQSQMDRQQGTKRGSRFPPRLQRTPIVDGDQLICQVGSAFGAGVVCFEKRTGKVIWKSQNDLASYASRSHKARRQETVRHPATERLLGIDPTNGKLLWSESVPDPGLPQRGHPSHRGQQRRRRIALRGNDRHGGQGSPATPSANGRTPS